MSDDASADGVIDSSGTTDATPADVPQDDSGGAGDAGDAGDADAGNADAGDAGTADGGAGADGSSGGGDSDQGAPEGLLQYFMEGDDYVNGKYVFFT